MGLLNRKNESAALGKAEKELTIINRLGLHARQRGDDDRDHQ